ncbi:MAG: HlyD family efflux transporter periplasmic adaptor subunit [Gemmatimonadota bacterium]|nr:HlyD family efflux transporter periplasmic adaptor subunit [Gemmatimonadota bacterium]
MKRMTSSEWSLASVVALSLLAVLAGCGGDDDPDAFGNFEATEVVVSPQASGQLLWFTPTEGTPLPAGAVVGLVDTTQMALERAQMIAQREATGARAAEVREQMGVLVVQREIAQRTYERTRRLFAEQAATAQQLDQAEREYRVLGAQIEAARAQEQSVAKEVASIDARVAQIRDRIAKSRVTNPQSGTVLTTYAKAGEVVQTGQPLYKIAQLDTLILRAYVTEGQLTSVRIGAPVRVRVDGGKGGLLTLPGIVSWVSSKAEFTPTPVQTRDERADLVYAIKVSVPNRSGVLKIGMPADVQLAEEPSP